MSDLQSTSVAIVAPATAAAGPRNTRKTLSLTGGAGTLNHHSSALNTAALNDNFYREDNLIKQASAFTNIHADIGPLNNLFSSKMMIKNKIN